MKWEYQKWVLIIFWVFCLACGENTSKTTDPHESTFSGNLKGETDDPKVQIQSLNKLIISNPDDYSLYESRAEMYYRLDSINAAIKDINRATELFPQGPDLYYYKGFYSFANKDTQSAVNAFKVAVGLGSTNPESYYQLGQLYFFQKKWDSAQILYKRAQEIQEEEPQYIFAQGFLLEGQQRPREAVRYYLEAIALDSSFAKAYLRLHDIYLYSYESEEEALKFNQLLLRFQPTHPLAQYNLGNYFFRKAIRITQEERINEFKSYINEAVSAYTIALNKDPNFFQAWYGRAYCYFLGDGRVNEAVRDLSKTLEINPDYAPAHFTLGSIYEQSGDLKTALDHYQSAVNADKKNEDFRRAVEEVSAKLR